MTIVTLMTDFGLKDGNVGVMKGVILGIAPRTELVDISHLIAPQNVKEAALIFLRSAPYFPAGTVHVVVVDPGVGTARRPLAARLGGQYYVGPDNGTITSYLERCEREGAGHSFVHLTCPEFWLPDPTHVFHGRDIFAPVAAHLAAGVALEKLGDPIHDPVRLSLPLPQRTSRGWMGEVIHVDHFGNIASNIRIELLAGVLEKKERISVRVAEVQVDGLVNTFGDRPPGALVALIGSTGNLLVCEVNGNAAEHLKVRPGDPFEAVFS